jgi:hypothetical protein
MSAYPRTVWTKVDGKVGPGYIDWGPEVESDDLIELADAPVPTELCVDPDCLICERDA